MADINIPQLINTIIILVGIFGSVLGAHGLNAKSKGKQVISSLSDIFSNVNKAATDEKVTEDEFQAILGDARVIYNSLHPSNPLPQKK